MAFASLEIPHAEIRPGWWLSADRVLYFAEERTLAVADIHWGYAQSHRRAGNLLPLWGNEEIAQRLRRALDRYRPKRMIWLGDSLHTAEAAEEAERFLDELREVEVIVVRGNHDRKWAGRTGPITGWDRACFITGTGRGSWGRRRSRSSGMCTRRFRGATGRGCG
jgi:hypothetical protein